jgi:hypothetical protein
MMPKGTLSSKEEGDCYFISYCRRKTGVQIPSIAPFGPRYYIPEQGGFSILTGNEKGCLLHWHFPEDDMPVVDLKKPNEMIQMMEDPANQHNEGGFGDEPLTASDSLMMAKAIHFVFGAILLINSRTELVERGRLVKKINRERRTELWTPYVVGKDYKVRYVSMSQESGGHHASPRLHWVRGFYRNQQCGPKNSQHKLIWIEPFTRGQSL